MMAPDSEDEANSIAKTPAEIINAVRRAEEKGLQVRLETDDGCVVETGIGCVDVDRPLAEETQYKTPWGEFSAILLPEGMHEVEDWLIGGMVSTSEANVGGWKPVSVGWVTEVDEDGNILDEYNGSVVAAKVIHDE